MRMSFILYIVHNKNRVRKHRDPEHDSITVKIEYTVNSRYLKVKGHPILLISESNISGPRKFTLRYQYFEITKS